MDRFLKVMRSRRWALALIVVFAVAAIAGTSFGERSLFTSAPFIVLTVWLATSTAVCAWERTIRAIRLSRGFLPPTDRSRPVAVFAPSSGDSESALRAVAAAFHGSRYRVSRVEDGFVAVKGRWAVWASPIFHWALVALVLVIAASRLTRYEGLVGVPVGATVVDGAEVYGRLDAAPLAVPFSGLEVAVTALDEKHVVRGVDFGPTPRVRVSRSGWRLTEGYVRPNDPLRAEGLLVHAAAYGLAARFAVTDEEGAVLGTSTVLVDFDDSKDSGATWDVLTLTPSGGSPIEIPVTIGARDSAGRVPRLLPPPGHRTAIVDVPATNGGSVSLKEGESVGFAPGFRLQFVEAMYYARLRFVADWGPMWIYPLFGVIVVSLSIALLAPTRIAKVTKDDEGQLELRVRDSARSALWVDRVTGIVSHAVGTDVEDGEGR